jgi:hypothetical protein
MKRRLLKELKLLVISGLTFFFTTPFAIAQLDGERISLSVDVFNNGRVIASDPQGIVTVGTGVEFEELADTTGNGFQVVPISIDLEGNRIFFDFSQTSFSSFATTDFNGYVFSDFDNTLPPFCHAIVSNQTAFGMTNARLRATENTLYVNVSSLLINNTSSLEITLFFTDKRSKPQIQFSSPKGALKKGNHRFTGRIIDSNQITGVAHRISGLSGVRTTSFSNTNKMWSFSFDTRRLRKSSFKVQLVASNICGELGVSTKRYRLRR